MDEGIIVSIPSQAGTLFGLMAWDSYRKEVRSLNTLSGGHPLRTRQPRMATLSRIPSQYPLRRAPSSDLEDIIRGEGKFLVSIPSQAGTLFGRGER